MVFKELDRNKKKVFQVILSFTVVSGFGFAGLNYFRGQYFLASIELTIAIISIGLLFYVKQINSLVHFKRLTLIYISVFFTIMMFAFSSEGVSISIFAWVLVIPLLSYLLLGVKSGFILTAVYYGITAVLFFSGFTSHPVLVDKVAYANMVVCALLFWGVSHSYEHTSESAKQMLKHLAISDHLTGLYNRTTLNHLFDKTVKLAEKNQEKLSLVLFDLDGFKSINDEFGHDTGDQVLIQFANILQQAVVDNGFAFRIGGEEFAVIFSAKSDLLILSLAENVRRDTEKIIITATQSNKSISVSAGVDTATPKEAVLSEMMKTADRRMYHGKNQGRNVVVHKG